MQGFKTSTSTLPCRPYVIKRRHRQRGDSIPASTSRSTRTTRCRHERMVEGSRDGDIVGTSFVSDPSAISRQLVDIISPKACQLCVMFRDKVTGEELSPVYGSGGLLRGPKIVGPPGYWQAHRQPPARKKAKFEEFASYEVTPATAKHNLKAEDGEEYVRSIIQFPGTSPIEIVMPDGGCVMEECIIVRPATDDVSAFATEDNDISFGSKETTPEKTVTKMPFLYQQVPNTFEIRAGHMIGMAVFRKYSIDHEDAEAPSSLDLTSRYGSIHQACIYTGKVTEISENGKTFCHNINTFEGCSGAIIFLLDKDQPEDMDNTLVGMAVGIHSGGLDISNNLAFKLPL